MFRAGIGAAYAWVTARNEKIPPRAYGLPMNELNCQPCIRTTERYEHV